MADILLGSHISLASPLYFLSAVREAASYGENCFMFYTGAPQNSLRKDVALMHVEEGLEEAKKLGIDIASCVIHAPYIINLASTENRDNYAFAISFLKEEISRCRAFGVPHLVLHPGARKAAPIEEAIGNLAAALDEAMGEDCPVAICLETMAGKGSEIGVTFEQIAAIREKVKDKDRVKVCLDTCHIFDAGYDVSDIDGVLDEFDRIVGLENLKVIHLNDSKTYRGSHKDRHENIGYGGIGYQTLRGYAHHPRLSHIPKILETPYVGDKPPYKKEIALLRGDYEENWRESLS